MPKEYIDELIEKGIEAVVIDVDNTITKSNVLDLLFFIKANSLHTIQYCLWVSFFFILKGPFYGILDFVNRDWFQKAFYAYHPQTTIAIADSKHDFAMLNYVDYPIVVSSKEKRWMKKLKNNPFLFR